MRLNTIQFLTNTSYMLSMVFIPLFAESLGATYFEIGVICAVFGATSFLSSFIFGKAADIHRLKKVIILGLVVSAITFFLQIFAYDPFSLAVTRGLAGFSVGMYPAALIVYVHYQKRSIGKFSSFGALGWMAGYLLAGLIGNIIYLFALSSLFYCFALLSAMRMEDIETPVFHVTYFSIDTFTNNIGTYLSFFIRHSGAVAVWTIFPLYLASLGANMFWIGTLYAINPAVQFLVMRRLDGFRNERLIVWGYLLSVVAFASYIIIPNYLFVIPGMIVVACSWSFIYVGSNQLLVERNIDKATAAGLLNSMIGASGITGALIGGVLSQIYGFEAVLLCGSIFSFIGLIIFRMFDSQKNRQSVKKIY
ncbi:MAG: MFS transporter [Methanosarcinaceae archaeon]|nr:MFS transporter [Methanosarcinaceae archaeon]